MKRLFILLIVLTPTFTFAQFINPLEFDGSDTQKKQVIEYIKSDVKETYCKKIDMCQEANLRMMEKENLEAFKKLTQATNKKILNKVIKDYCYSGIDICNYVTINIMYDENEKASKETLEW